MKSIKYTTASGKYVIAKGSEMLPDECMISEEQYDQISEVMDKKTEKEACGNMATSLYADLVNYGNSLKGFDRFIWYMFQGTKRFVHGYEKGWNAAMQLMNKPDKE